VQEGPRDFAVAVDQIYFTELGIEGPGDHAEINADQVTVKAVTQGIRSFTTLPFIFTGLEAARTLVGAEAEQATYTLVRVAPVTTSRLFANRCRRACPIPRY
jgi:putative ABC transport system permease protein